MVDDTLDCYGILYEPMISPCKNKCELKHMCRSELQKRFARDGVEQTKKKQREVILAQEKRSRDEAEEYTDIRNIQPDISPFVSEIIGTLTGYGLKPYSRKGYMTFKMGKRSVLTITRFRTETMDDLVKFVLAKNHNDFPEPCRPLVSENKRGRYLTCKARDLMELRKFLDDYLPTIKPEVAA